MSIHYSAEEIYDIGIQIEINGREFYKSAAKKTADPDTKRLCNDLGNWEEKHVEIFERLKEEFCSNEKDALLDLDQQQYLYLKATADNHIFLKTLDIAALVAQCKNPVEILEMALKFEKDSVVLYLSMSDLVPEKLGRSHIAELVNEELRHVYIIQEQISRLT
ncbi:MAG: ferritin family protein [Chitinivibrionales bacterium]|nr:ferritin family protein [Chitinivibrionales bacterium]